MLGALAHTATNSAPRVRAPIPVMDPSPDLVEGMMDWWMIRRSRRRWIVRRANTVRISLKVMLTAGYVAR